MRLLGKYFFSPKIDILAFATFIPIYLLYCLFFETGFFSLPANPPFIFFVLGWTLVDGSHVYSTILVSYSDRSVFEKLKLVMILVPVLLLITAFAFQYSGDPQPFLYFLAYLAMIHFIRQEFGWMKIASRFDSGAPKWLYHVDVNTSYLMTILPMLWFMRASNKYAFWYEEGDLFRVPDAIANAAINLYWPVLAIFLLVNVYHTFKSKTFNLSKFLVFINTFFGWYMAKVHVQHPYLALWLMIFHHGIPYYFIVFKTERVSKNVKLFQPLGKFKYPVIYLACAGVFYLFLKAHAGNSYVESLRQDQLFNSIIYAIAVMPQMTHFILDGFIWKKKYGLVGR